MDNVIQIPLLQWVGQPLDLRMWVFGRSDNSDKDIKFVNVKMKT